MRLTPLLLAVLAYSATLLGVANSSNAQAVADASLPAHPNSNNRVPFVFGQTPGSIRPSEQMPAFASMVPASDNPVVMNAQQLASENSTPLAISLETASPVSRTEEGEAIANPFDAALSELDGNQTHQILAETGTAEPQQLSVNLSAPQFLAQETPTETNDENNTAEPVESQPEVNGDSTNTDVDADVDADTDMDVDADTDADTPTVAPSPPVQQPPNQPRNQQAQPEPQVLVAEVVVSGAPEDLQSEVYRVIRTRPGFTTTRSQLQQDINAIFATGYFSNVRAVPEDTPLGVRVTFAVDPNPVLRSVQVQGDQVLPAEVIDTAFRDQYGRILNLRDFQEGVKQLNQWYQDNGYVLAQVIDSPQIAPDGTVTLVVAEGIVENVEIRFLDRDGNATDTDGEPIDGRTREYIITREMQLQPGQVFNRAEVERDLQRIYGLGIFEDVQLSLNPGTDPRRVIVVVNVSERRTGSLAAGAGVSSASGLFGTVSYQEQNLFGRNQKLGAELQVGQRELLFDVSFTDPWIAGDPNRTSYTVNLFRRRTISLIFDGGDEEIELPDDGGRPRIVRLGGGVNFTRPLGRDPLDSEWRGSIGLQYQRVSIRDNDGDISPFDEEGNQLSFSDGGEDDLFAVQLGLVRDRRNNAAQPTSGSLFRVGTEQSIPIGLGSILFNRVRGSYSQYIPVQWTNFTEGPQTLAFNVQAGTVIGDLPPYEAFLLGGSNSVRGYGDGEVGSGRSFVQATAEYRFPIISVVGGALFVDVASDLGTGDNVPGDPAGVRGKPGFGFGYGAGLRVQSPIGAIRVDFGINDDGESRFHFGLGERF